MKRTMILLLALMMIALTACSNAPGISLSGSESEYEETTSSETETAKLGESFSQEASAETATDTEEPPLEAPEESQEVSATEITEVEPKRDEAPSSQAVNDPPPDKHEEKGSSTPEPETPQPKTETPASEEPKPVENPEPDPEPEETSTPEPETQPEPEPQSESDPEPEPVQSFNIDYWISYAQSVAISKGLALENSAVDCWDNPISANPDCVYLERDINSRLSRYAGDEDITDVWIWSECIGENMYLIYIGYA